MVLISCYTKVMLYAEKWCKQGWITAGMEKGKGMDPGKQGRMNFLPNDANALDKDDELMTLRIAFRYICSKYFPACVMRMESEDKGV